MSSGPSIVLNTPTVLLDKDFDPFVDQIVPNYAEEDEGGGGGGGGWDQSSCLTDQIFATTEIIQHEDEEDEDEHKDENKNQVSSVETVSCSSSSTAKSS